MSKCVFFENWLFLLGKIGLNLGGGGVGSVFTLLQKAIRHYKLSGKKEMKSFSDL